MSRVWSIGWFGKIRAKTWFLFPLYSPISSLHPITSIGSIIRSHVVFICECFVACRWRVLRYSSLKLPRFTLCAQWLIRDKSERIFLGMTLSFNDKYACVKAKTAKAARETRDTIVSSSRIFSFHSRCVWLYFLSGILLLRVDLYVFSFSLYSMLCYVSLFASRCREYIIF